ncbi:ATP-dependent DNA helicase [Curtobacterium sp. 20TX0008]|uniref:ATP-dependent DNA helicase n=1 Tax=Curtobacterium sp. 20TX0008 TaxID=3022018 RepID=UPI00232DC472|nr:helicase C-terminal domain-containing protein [Curtobacterium sp. 20TX0008]MDB6425863.1 helicase C-terminal domain-containing protein [Curtobacterium sp. 20TX0008]
MGIGNYLDPRQLFSTANLLAGSEAVWDTAELREGVAAATAVPSAINSSQVCLERLVALVSWGLDQYDDDDAAGTRHEFDGDHTGDEWALVSAGSANQASKDDDTPYVPKALLARAASCDADVVVTNHTLLALQATTGRPIVNGSMSCGVFDNIIIDEAHALAPEVRKRGAAEVSGRLLHSLIRAVERVADGPAVTSWSSGGAILADRLEQSIASQLDRGGKPLRMGELDDPLAAVGDHLDAWVGQVKGLVRNASQSPHTATAMGAIRALERAEELREACDAVREHRVGRARWVQADERPQASVRWSSAQASPVDVSGMIRRNLLVGPSEVGEEPPALGVIFMSATLPDNFQFEVGANVPAIEYPSPFAVAYQSSALYIPAVVSTNHAREVPRLTSERWGKRKFDTQMHTTWAAEQINDLVERNNGSALILAATSAAGRVYAEALRGSLPTDVDVFSQWDGATSAALLQRWRENTSSVLVGTRSLMTGVDAPGETCSLVILDRIPRSPSNPSDDARAEAAMARLQCDKWTADRLIYAADAALLEKQAVGRMIRSASDSGMVAVLDPRLVRTQVGAANGIAYPEPTRQVYAKPLRAFSRLILDLDEACEWLSARRAGLRSEQSDAA